MKNLVLSVIGLVVLSAAAFWVKFKFLDDTSDESATEVTESE